MIGKAWRLRFGEVDFVDGSGAKCDFWSGRGVAEAEHRLAVDLLRLPGGKKARQMTKIVVRPLLFAEFLASG